MTFASNTHCLYPGLLQPLPIPQQAWTDVSMDFVEGLPKSMGKDNILVVVDRLTKFSCFIGLTHPVNDVSVAKLFFDTVVGVHGIPLIIVSDRDSVFTSGFWQELFKLFGTQVHMTTPYHPASNGQTERVNQCVESYLRCMVFTAPNQYYR